MSGSTIQKRFLLTGLVSFTIGLERLLNAALLGPQTADSSTHLTIGLVCSVVGILLLAVTLVRRVS